MHRLQVHGSRRVAARHLDISLIEEDTFAEGQMFDGSSIAGWKDSLGHVADAGSRVRHHRPVLCRNNACPGCDVLKPTTGKPSNRDPRGIARKAEAMVEQKWCRRHGDFRSGSGVLHLRRREVLGFALQYRLQARTRPSFRPTPTPITKAATSATIGQERLLPGSAAELGPGHAFPRCSPPWPRWAPWSKSITTKSPLLGMNSA